ncbi:MAG: sensor histidine kinase [Bryobacteraceae bacterium]
MNWFDAARISERAVFRGLVAGFALVLALLGLAGLVAVRGTRAIEADAAEVGREQIAMARLLNEVQAGQHAMAAILHQLAPGLEIGDHAKLVSELAAADRALSHAAAAAATSPEAPRWRELEKAGRAFSDQVRLAIESRGPRTPARTARLFDLHDRLVDVEQDLLVASEERMKYSERRIEAESRQLASQSRLLLGTCLVLAAICAIITIHFARTSIRKIERQANELSRVSWHMLQSQESLARRFSHELHDELGQSLAAVKANLSAGGSASWNERRADCIHLVDSAIANVRELSQLLHPVILDDFGLDAGLRWLTDGFEQRTGIATSYISDFRGRLDDEVETHLFRIAQEALTNAARHSGATAVRVTLARVAPGVQMTIEDNGRGLARGDSDENRPSLGLVGMRARAKEIGAVLAFGVPNGGGVRIEVDLPTPRRIEEKDAEPEKTHIAGR